MSLPPRVRYVLRRSLENTQIELKLTLKGGIGLRRRPTMVLSSTRRRFAVQRRGRAREKDGPIGCSVRSACNARNILYLNDHRSRAYVLRNRWGAGQRLKSRAPQHFAAGRAQACRPRSTSACSRDPSGRSCGRLRRGATPKSSGAALGSIVAGRCRSEERVANLLSPTPLDGLRGHPSRPR